MVSEAYVHRDTRAVQPGMAKVSKRAAVKELAPFGRRLRTAIAESPKFKNRADFLRRAGVEAVTMRRYETGERSPPLSEVTKWAALLGVSASYLAGEDVKEERATRTEPIGSTDPVWQKFERAGLVDRYRKRGLTDDDFAWVRRAPGRRGQRNVDFLIDLCEMLLEGAVPNEDFDKIASDDEGPDASHLIKPK